MSARLLAGFESGIVEDVPYPKGFAAVFNRWAEEHHSQVDTENDDMAEVSRQLLAFAPIHDDVPSAYFVEAYLEWVQAWERLPSGDPRRAFSESDADASRQAHDAKRASEEHETGLGEYTKSLVYGGLDGILSTFAMVCAIQGGNLSMLMVFVLGMAKLMSGAIGMALGDYLSSVAEVRYQRAERAREEWELDNFPEGEVQEMVDYYMERGLEVADAEELVALLMKKRELFVDTMMVAELGIMPEEDEPAKMALVTFFSFLIFGAVPLLVYFLALFIPGMSPLLTFLLSCVAVGGTLFALGALKSKFTAQSWLLAGSVVLGYGFVGAFIAYSLGWIVQVILEQI